MSAKSREVNNPARGVEAVSAFLDFLQQYARQHPEQGPIVVMAGMPVVIVWIVVRNYRR